MVPDNGGMDGDDARRLEEGLRFTSAELAFNREGRLSARQRAGWSEAVVVYRRVATWNRIAVLGGLVGSAVMLFGASVALASQRWALLAAAALAVVGALFVWRRDRARRALADHQDRGSPPAPLVTEGPAILSTQEAGGWGGTNVYVQLGAMTFYLREPASSQVFVEGTRYRAYYLETPTRWLLSAERLS